MVRKRCVLGRLPPHPRESAQSALVNKAEQKITTKRREFSNNILFCQWLTLVLDIKKPELLPLSCNTRLQEYPVTSYQPRLFFAETLEDVKKVVNKGLPTGLLPVQIVAKIKMVQLTSIVCIKLFISIQSSRVYYANFKSELAKCFSYSDRFFVCLVWF